MNPRVSTTRWILAALLGAWLAGAQPARPPSVRSAGVDLEALSRHGKREAFSVHDPSTIVRCKDEFWFFCTGAGIHSWRSKDLLRWDRGPRVFEAVPAWVTNVVAGNRGHFWAPDVIFLEGRYLLYYSISRFGANTSAIALVSNATLDPGDPAFKWRDEGVVVRSSKTNDFNAIDPGVIRTGDGQLWMVFGSFWSGIKLARLDPKTGLRIAPESPLYSLAQHEAIEAAAIHYHDGYYYLFVNWGRCCRGVNSTYEIRVGRAREITGPYLDREGADLARGGGSLFLASDGPFIGPGHAGILEFEGRTWFSCHFYDETRRGDPTLAIQPAGWGEDGWPFLERAD